MTAIVCLLGCLLMQTPSVDGKTEAPAEVVDSGRKIIPLSLEQCVRLGLRNNLSIRLQELGAYRSMKDIEVASAAFDPLFTTSYNMSKFRQPTVDTLSGLGSTTAILVNPFIRQSLRAGLAGKSTWGADWSLTAGDDRSDNPNSGFFGINPRNTTTVVFNIEQPLLKNFGYDVNLADLRIARETNKVETWRYRAQVEDSIKAIVDAYWNLFFTQNELRVKTEALREAQLLLEINERKLAVGTAKEIDVISAQAEIATQLAEIIRSRNAIATATDALLDLMDFAEYLRRTEQSDADPRAYGGFSIELTTELNSEPYSIDTDSALRLALEQRTELKIAESERRSAQLRLMRAKRQLRPKLDLSGTWTQTGLEKDIDDSVDELFSGSYYDWTVAVNFEYALGNRSARNQLLQAESDAQSADLTARQSRNAVILEVTRAVRDIGAVYEGLLARREQSRLRREQLEGERQRLRAGTSTSYEVLQIQNDLLEAETEELRATVDYQNALTAYRRAVGLIARPYTSSKDAEEPRGDG